MLSDHAYSWSKQTTKNKNMAFVNGAYFCLFFFCNKKITINYRQLYYIEILIIHCPVHVLELFLFEIKFQSPRSIDYYTKLLNVEKFPSSLLPAIYEGSGTIKWGVIAGNISCSTRMLLPGLTLLSSALSGVKYSISALLKKKKTMPKFMAISEMKAFFIAF